MKGTPWGEMTQREQQLTISLTFVAGYARMHDLETNILIVPGRDGELARLKKWWHNLGEEKRECVSMWVRELPAECELFAKEFNARW